MKNRVINRPDKCRWCGGSISGGLASQGDNICIRCENNREWLLKCIRHGDMPSKYVARVEAREAGERKAREIAAMQKPVHLQLPSAQPKSEDRLDRLEKILSALVEKLGAKE